MFFKSQKMFCQIPYFKMYVPTFKYEGSGCGLVGKAVASDNRGPQFECSH